MSLGRLRRNRGLKLNPCLLKDKIGENKMKRFLIEISKIILSVLLGILFACAIISCMNAEDELVNEYCSCSSGYEYGQCQALIY